MEIGLGGAQREGQEGRGRVVLILVLVEIGLGVEDRALCNLGFNLVLILVLVEIGLGEVPHRGHHRTDTRRLNPCFSGNRFGRATATRSSRRNWGMS